MGAYRGRIILQPTGRSMIIKGNRKLSLFIAGYTFGLTMLACIGYLCADFTVKQQRMHRTEEQRFRTDLAYVNLPRLNLTLPATSGQSGRVRIDLSLAVEKQYAGRVEDIEPRIAERIGDYVSKLDFDDLSQPKATLWLRKKLLEEAASTTPLPIIDVIFDQFVIL